MKTDDAHVRDSDNIRQYGRSDPQLRQYQSVATPPGDPMEG